MAYDTYDNEPSMEEILASIRRIISEDDYSIKSLDDFHKWVHREDTRATDTGPLGYYQDATVVKFFADKNEELLADIVAENAKQNMGNTTVPGTAIKLINYSACPFCATIHTLLDLANYYANPTPDRKFSDLNTQCRKDTRVHCKECRKYFLPSLVIADGTPISEYQWLCSTQTIDATQEYYQTMQGRKVLFSNIANRVCKDNYWGINIDITMDGLKSRPALASNLLQYSPPAHIIRFVNNHGFTNDDVIFNRWYRQPERKSA